MDDTEIIALYQARQEGAIQKTAEKYGAYLHTISYNILASHQDAEEAVGDTYFAAWNAIPPEIPRVLKHYLARITRNLSFDKLRYQTAKRRSSHMVLLLSELDACIPDPRSSVEAAWERNAVKEALDRFLAGLEELDCAVFLSRYFYGRTIAQIGESYGLTQRTVKYRLGRMRLALRGQLEKEGISV